MAEKFVGEINFYTHTGSDKGRYKDLLQKLKAVLMVNLLRKKFAREVYYLPFGKGITVTLKAGGRDHDYAHIEHMGRYGTSMGIMYEIRVFVKVTKDFYNTSSDSQLKELCTGIQAVMGRESMTEHPS